MHVYWTTIFPSLFLASWLHHCLVELPCLQMNHHILLTFYFGSWFNTIRKYMLPVSLMSPFVSIQANHLNIHISETSLIKLYQHVVSFQGHFLINLVKCIDMKTKSGLVYIWYVICDSWLNFLWDEMVTGITLIVI